MDNERQTDENLAREVVRAVEGEASAGAIVRVGRLAASSARAAGAGAVASGRWLADLAVETAKNLPLRDRDALRRQYGDLADADLAEALIRSASHASAALGAAAGALVDVEELSPPAWLAIPAELVVETLLIAAIEMKLAAELHEAYRQPVRGTPAQKGVALARAWAEGRGIRVADLAGGAALSEVLGQGARAELTRLLRRRLFRRLGRSLTGLAPLLAGAVAGAEVNRRGTVSFGQAVVRDLAAMR